MEAAIKTFFSSPYFAVAGASSDPSKYGHKVFKWYLGHSLPAAPLNPHVPAITVESTTHATVDSPTALPHPAETSLSIITPPTATAIILRAAKNAGVRAVWMQPGSFDAATLAWAREQWPGAAVAGDDEAAEGGGRGGEGWCVLVDGEEGLRKAGKL